MKPIYSFLAAILLTFSGFSQDSTFTFVSDTMAKAESKTTTLPIQLTFVSPLGTNGIQNFTATNNVSINIIGGVSGALEGLEVGGFANVLRYNSYGMQVSGAVNVAGQNFTGIQSAGFVNVTKDTLLGIQTASFANFSGPQPDFGMQISGFANVANGEVNGLQASGFANTAKGDVHGVQVTGVSNVAIGNFTGLQLSGLTNYTHDTLMGAQMGVFNGAKTVYGTQLGFINIAHNYEMGTPIGFLSIVRCGYHKLELSYNETSRFNVALKTGTRHFYNQFMGGYTPGEQWYNWSVGYGIGSMWKFTPRFFAGVEASTSTLFNSNPSANNYVANSLNRMTFNITYRLGFLEIFGSAGLNVYVEDNYFNTTEQFNAPGTLKPLYEYKGDYVRTMLYPAFSAGIRI